jgi:tRNA(Arg) A34 adenosine deaminase TadA
MRAPRGAAVASIAAKPDDATPSSGGRFVMAETARIARRRALALAGAAFAVAGTTAARPGSLNAQTRDPIAQPANPGKAAFMARAIAMRDAAARAGDQPYGAVIVKDGRIVGEAPSRVITGTDPTAHAETEAIRDAARRLGTRDLSGCEIYASTRPCPMCEAAAYWAGIARIYHDADAADAGAPRLSRC